MDTDLKVGIIVVVVLVAAITAIPIYFTLTSPKVDVSGFQVVSTSPGLTADAYSLQRYAQVDANLTVYLHLSSSWPIIIKNITVATPGFSIVSINASLPLMVEHNMTIPIVLQSDQPYSGAVLLVIGNANASDLQEKILVPDVNVDLSTKTVTFVSILNAGDVPLSNSTAYLIRSDDLIVNSTQLPTTGQLPGNITFYDIELSYTDATVIEIYHVKVVTAAGANASSRAIWLTCNC